MATLAVARAPRHGSYRWFGSDGRPAARVLFDLLADVQRRSATGLLRIEDSSGQPVGEVIAAGGRLCLADAGGWAPLDLSADDSDLTHIASTARQALREGRRASQVLFEVPAVPVDRVRLALLARTADALLAIAKRAASERLGVREVGARNDYDHRLTFSALDVFLTAASELDTAPEDGARLLFREYGDCSDAALLLTKAATAGGLPLPVVARGFEETALEDVVKMARAAAEMARERELLGVRLAPRVYLVRADDAVWLAASGLHRIALIRTGPDFQAGQMLGFALHIARSRA